MQVGLGRQWPKHAESAFADVAQGFFLYGHDLFDPAGVRLRLPLMEDVPAWLCAGNYPVFRSDRKDARQSALAPSLEKAVPLGSTLDHPDRQMGAFIIEREAAVATDKLKFSAALLTGNRKGYAAKIIGCGWMLHYADGSHALVLTRHGFMLYLGVFQKPFVQSPCKRLMLREGDTPK